MSCVVYVGMGSNLGDRLAQLRRAVASLQSAGEIERSSSVYETEPIGPVLDQPRFLNAVVALRTNLEPRQLLRRLQQLEQELGRAPGVPKGPRVIDLDLLLFGDRVAAWPELVIPHPELARRAFVLVPLLELASGAVDPRSGRPLAAYLAELGEAQVVRRVAGSIA